MRPSEALHRYREDIRRIVQENRSANPRIFGSVLRGSDSESSDLDILIDPTRETSLLDVARIQNQIQVLLGVRVDVLTPAALPQKFRDQVLSEAVPV
ncbi:MAG TPA: nucleotidyltransferase family protein [Alloacidobacterium sp.]|nr:nucleotidyltransferase family protein [Alloacidobacterium sp.]